jgi:hypothetical protein
MVGDHWWRGLISRYRFDSILFMESINKQEFAFSFEALYRSEVQGVRKISSQAS